MNINFTQCEGGSLNEKKLLCAILAGTMILSVPVYAKDLSVTVPSYVTDAGLSDFT